jgi:hypothetical protein
MKLLLASALLFVSGCLMPGPQLGYIPDKDIHIAGWDCPTAEP